MTAHQLGAVFAAETGFRLETHRARAADVSFVRAVRLGEEEREQLLDGAPDLAVEVVSPSDRWCEVMQKVGDWLAHGATSVWIVDPDGRSIPVHHRGGAIVSFKDPQSLPDEAIFADFGTPLPKVFARTW